MMQGSTGRMTLRDERGFYYFPILDDKKVRMYVRRNSAGEIEYRMWEAQHPEVWEDHQWLPRRLLAQFQEFYHKNRNGKANPLTLYDEKIAEALLKNTSADKQ